MQKTYQFTAGDLYAYQALAAQAYSTMGIPDVQSIGEHFAQDHQIREKKLTIITNE